MAKYFIKVNETDSSNNRLYKVKNGKLTGLAIPLAQLPILQAQKQHKFLTAEELWEEAVVFLEKEIKYANKQLGDKNLKLKTKLKVSLRRTTNQKELDKLLA